MRSRRWFGVVMAVLVASAACDDATGPQVKTARLSAQRESGGIRLTNLTSEPSGYFLFDVSSLALIDWSPCASFEPECLRLPAHGSVLVPFTEVVMGSASSEQIVIYNWWVVPDIEGMPVVDMDEPVILKK